MSVESLHAIVAEYRTALHESEQALCMRLVAEAETRRLTPDERNFLVRYGMDRLRADHDTYVAIRVSLQQQYQLFLGNE